MSFWSAAATRCGPGLVRLVVLLGLVGVLAGAGCGSDGPVSPSFEIATDEVPVN